MSLQKGYLNKLIDVIFYKSYSFFYKIFSRFSGSFPTFIIVDAIHYVMIKNILPYLTKYKLYPGMLEAREYLIKHNIPFSRYMFFPKYIVEASFLSVDRRYNRFSISLQSLLQIKNREKIQVYHGVADKVHTYSELNKDYNLLLVPGKYARVRLQLIGVDRKKIRIVGFPKFDSYYRKTKKKELFREQAKQTILYAPTWGIISSLPFMIRKLTQLKEKYKLIVKLHRYTDWYYIDFLKWSGITVYDGEDITDLFHTADVMISDSSSAMFEFLITGRPIIVLDVGIWAKGMPYTNATLGPEISLRNIFYRVSNIDNLEGTIQMALKKKNHTNTNARRITKYLFEPIYPAGKKAAEEIMKFIRKK